MGAIEDLLQLVEETLGCELHGMQLMHGDRVIADIGRQENCAHLLEIPNSCYKANLFSDKDIIPNEKEIDHIRKIFNLYAGQISVGVSNIFSSAEILDTITSRKTVDEVMHQLVDVLVSRGGFCRAGIMFLNEALLELRGVIYAGNGDNPGSFKNVKLQFQTKNQLSDIMFYDRTEVVSTDTIDGAEVLKEYFCNNMLVTGLGIGDRPIGILIACKDSYARADKDTMLLYGNICSLSIEFSRTVKQLELTMADLGNLRKTAMNSENLVKMGRLSATVAHELKNPLVAIGGFTKRMEQTAVNPQTKNYIKIVQSEVHRLEKIVGDILVYSRKVELELTNVDINAMFNDVMQIAGGCLCFNRIGVKMKIPENLTVTADKDKLKQVVMNIVSNSVQAMPEGGELTVEANDGGKHVTISVSDTGGGIPADKREKIFEPFYTLKKSGTGLGLPLCKKIMTAHGGDVVVGDTGTGAVFTLILPKRG